MYHFKGNTAKKRFNDFENEIKLFEKIKSGGTKLEEAKKLQNMFKSNLTEISRGRYKSKEKEWALQNIKLPYKTWEAVIKLFNDYSSIASKAKNKSILGKGCQAELVSHFKMITPK